MTFHVPVPKKPEEPKVMACALRSNFFLYLLLAAYARSLRCRLVVKVV